MLNFGASKPRVKGGGARAPGAPPGSTPEFSEYKSDKGIIFDSLAHNFCLTLASHLIGKTRHHI